MSFGAGSLFDFTGLSVATAPPVPERKAAFFSLFDFTGVPVGAPPPAPVPGRVPGFYSLFDFTGVPVGAPPAVIVGPRPVGFYSLFDFTGVPVGYPPQTATVSGKGKAVGGKLWAQAILRKLMAERETETAARRRDKLKQIRTLAIVDGLEVAYEEDRKSAAVAGYAVLLSEL